MAEAEYTGSRVRYAADWQTNECEAAEGGDPAAAPVCLGLEDGNVGTCWLAVR